MIFALATVGALVVGVAIGYLRGKLAMKCIHDSECPCYSMGYSDGKDKAHFELRAHVRANHAADCGCEPCKTERAGLPEV